MTLVTQIYRITQAFPPAEIYGLTSQIRRAAVSIPSNLAEGFARQTNGDFARFLAIANGSLAELETQMIIAVNLGFVHHDELKEADGLASEVGKMINALSRKLRDASTSENDNH